MQAKISPAKRVIQQLKVWREYRQAITELSALPDRDLWELGITRGGIAAAVKQPRKIAPVSQLNTTASAPAPMRKKAA